MSKKPEKKSDLSKSWMKNRQDKKVFVRPEYHLIISEGTKTEPHYFEGLKKEINEKYGKGRIHIEIEGEGRNTLSLLKRAQKYVKDNNNPIRHVWLIYDKDDFPLDDFDNTYHKCTDLNKKNHSENPDEHVTYHALWSNQCIELWFLLHFAYHQSDVHRDEYKPVLDKYFSKLNANEYKKIEKIFIVFYAHI